ncbi:unnamed protein product [Anisakis simplex]|uniref:Ectopic P granules protein 5 homolog (inferred by orthology to a human protein) n=1 Tax=Anisakis simplex TaxID=6269 RepID=A0A0M3JQV3_ANISI|nr:unnamed protein product [Anisakis simplex]
MEAERPRRPKTKPKSKSRNDVASVDTSTVLTMTELERRLEELPTDFDEIPTTSSDVPDADHMVIEEKEPKSENTECNDTAECTSTATQRDVNEPQAREGDNNEQRDASNGKNIAKANQTETITKPLPAERSAIATNEHSSELDESSSSKCGHRTAVVPELSISDVYPSLRNDKVGEVSSEFSSPNVEIYPELYDEMAQSASSVADLQAPPLPTETKFVARCILPLTRSANCPLKVFSKEILSSFGPGFGNVDYFDGIATFFTFKSLQQEESPRNNLFEYLENYKKVCEKIALNDVNVAECEELIKACALHTWIAENRVINQEGKCGDDKYATGSATYLVATLDKTKLSELSQLLKRDVNARLDSSLSLEIEARALALQIQWMIVDLNNAFMREHCLTANSPPCFIIESNATVSRTQLRGALSDAFHFLRYPGLSSRFIDSVTAWITELSAVLLKACTSEDQQYLLCQLLRLASPVANWAAPLLQTYVNMNPLNDRFVIDHVVTMLAILLSPIRARESFLQRIVNYENDDNSWAILSEDVDEGEVSLAAVNETDLIAFLDQFSTEALFAKAIQHFTAVNRSNAVAQVLMSIAFELVLLKIFDEGLTTYSHPQFRQFCKQIGLAMRQSVRYLADFVGIAKRLLSADEIAMVEKEFDRILLHAVHYIVSKQSLGLWQFLVDLPYSVISGSCRLRCQILLRSSEPLSISQLYEIPEKDLNARLKAAGLFVDRLLQLPNNDSNYMVSALAALMSYSETHSDDFLMELLNACFLDESTRDNYYKVGSEAIGVLVDKQPQLLSKVLLIIDRNIDSLDQYAVEILSNAPLAKCRLSESDVGSICGKWLINRSPDHPGSRIARRVLGSMNWGRDSNGELWLHRRVHQVCAETIVKGHMAQCKGTNGLIAKSFNKVAKLASKVPDYEQQFDTFCWDILLRLKLPILNDPASPFTDLASFYVHIVQKCLSSFVQTFDRLLHSDQSSYAAQLIAGSDQFPGPTLKLLSSAITVYHLLYSYHITEQYTQSSIDSWIRLLCCERATEWNTDKYTLYLLDVITRLVFEKNVDDLLSMVDLIKCIYMAMIQKWKENSRGMLSWFTAEQSAPPLIASANLPDAPWASFLLLLAEQRSFDEFYEALYSSMGKHPKYTLEQAVGKAANKSHFSLDVTRLHYYRWLEFCCADKIEESIVFPLALQQLVIRLFTRTSYLAAKICYGGRYWSCSVSQAMFETLRKKILVRCEQSAKVKETAVYYKAVGQWLSNTAIYEPNFRAFDDLLLDHLVQLIIAGDLMLWTQFVDMNCLHEQRNESCKVGRRCLSQIISVLSSEFLYCLFIKDKFQLYAFTCHLGTISNQFPSETDVATIAEIVAKLNARNRALPFPQLPMHPSLPNMIKLDISDACNSQVVLPLFSQQLNSVNNAARAFITAKEGIESLDESYLKEYPRLYTNSTTQLSIVLQCGYVFGINKCAHPITVTATVNQSQYQSTVEAAMNDNRQKRSNEVAAVFAQLLNPSAVNCAHLQYVTAYVPILNIYNSRQSYFVSRQHYRKMHEMNSVLSGFRAQQLQISGRTLFYHAATSISSLELISPASATTYAFVLTKLGQAFIANHSNEQTHLMSIVLGGSHLAHLLTEHFTPHCVPSSQLLSLYSALSQAVRNPSTSSAALSLLSQLDIKKTGEKLPPHQFSQLMPIAFENIISITDSSSPLYDICTKHFIHSLFHRFPENFISGLKLALAACDTSATPVDVFDLIIDPLNAKHIDSLDSKPEFVIDAITAAEATKALEEKFIKSRRELSTRLYSVWSKYLSRVMVLVEFFAYKMIALPFDSEQSISKLEAELRQQFTKCTQLFAPLIEPFGAGFAAWNPNDVDGAICVMDCFVSLMIRIHSLYDTYLPPGSENLETLLFDYYASTIGELSRGGTHNIGNLNRWMLFIILLPQFKETRLTRLPWNIFWPNLVSLALMKKVLSEGAAESAPLITQIVVRIPWITIIQHQSVQPLDGMRAFYGLLLEVLTRCISRPINYVACRASMPKLLDSLSVCQWRLMSVDQLSDISSFIVSSFPTNALTDSSDVMVSFLTTYRRVCCFSTVPSNNFSFAEEYQRQAIYVRTQVAMMRKNSRDKAWAVDFYAELIKSVNAIIVTRGDTTDQPACLSHELTAFWAHVTDAKFAGPGSCDWTVPTNWIILPDSCRQYLYTLPSSENGVTPQFLTMHVYVNKSLQKCSSAEQETTILKNLFEYLSGLKPNTQFCRYVTNEAAFVLIIDKILKLTLRQFGFGLQQGNESLMAFIDWLVRVHSEEKSSSFFSMIGLSKKQSFSIRLFTGHTLSQRFFLLRYLSNVIELFLTQQTTASDRAPRNAPNTPVLNTRIQAFKDMSSSKLYAQFQATSHLALPFFTKVRFYHIAHAVELFALLVNSLFTEKFLKSIQYL